MRQDNELRSLPSVHLVIAATAVSLAGALGQTGVAATALKMPTPLAQPEGRLCIVGTPTVQWKGASGSFHVDRVENHYRTASEGLTLHVALAPTYPDFSTPARLSTVTLMR